jgi:hypothetical protein
VTTVSVAVVPTDGGYTVSDVFAPAGFENRCHTRPSELVLLVGRGSVSLPKVDERWDPQEV